MGDKTRVGRHDGRIQKMLYEKVVLPTITYNMESTTNMTNKNGGNGNNTMQNEERMNRELQQKTTTMKKLRFLMGVHANESQYVKYCGMEENN